MILFVAYGGGHVAALAPIALALRAAGRPFIFLALTTAKAYLDRLGIPSIGFRDLPGAGDHDVQEYGERLARDMPPGGSVAHEETVAYLGLNFRDLVAAHGVQRASELYKEHGRQAFLPVRTMKAAFTELRPELVIATNSPRAERGAIVAASECGVRSLCVVDLFAVHEMKWVGLPGFADRVCVLNNHVRDTFVAFGRHAKDLVVTGNPAFDRLLDPAVVATGGRMRTVNGWDDGGTTILFASQPEPTAHPFTGERGDPELPRRIEQQLREFVAANRGYRLVVRYHPSERVEFVPAPQVAFSPPTQDLASLLHAVDVVVVTSSTVGLEASLAGRAVVSVDASIFQADAPYSAMGISVGVARVEDLPAALRGIGVRGPGTGNGKSVEAGNSGTATARVVEVIDTILR